MCVQKLKFVALPVPGIIGCTPKCGQSLDPPMLPFLKNFNGLLFAWTLLVPDLKMCDSNVCRRNVCRQRMAPKYKLTLFIVML